MTRYENNLGAAAEHHVGAGAKGAEAEAHILHPAAAAGEIEKIKLLSKTQTCICTFHSLSLDSLEVCKSALFKQNMISVSAKRDENSILNKFMCFDSTFSSGRINNYDFSIFMISYSFFLTERAAKTCCNAQGLAI